MRLHALSWTPKQLEKLLSARLDYFSNGHIQSLAALAAPELRQIDEQLCEAAQGSPRTLLSLGELLFRHCASTSTSQEALIQPIHVQHMLNGEQPLDLIYINPTPTMVHSSTLSEPAAHPPPIPHMAEGGASPTTTIPAAHQLSPSQEPQGVPLLSIRGGVIYFDERPWERSDKLPRRRRQLLNYLYEHRGNICEREAIVKALWGDQAFVDDTTLRNLAKMLTSDLPNGEHYILKISGGGYRLDHTADPRN